MAVSPATMDHCHHVRPSRGNTGYSYPRRTVQKRNETGCYLHGVIEAQAEAAHGHLDVLWPLLAQLPCKVLVHAPQMVLSGL